MRPARNHEGVTDADRCHHDAAQPIRLSYLVVPRGAALVFIGAVQSSLFLRSGVGRGKRAAPFLFRIPSEQRVSGNLVAQPGCRPSDLPSMLVKAVVFGLQIAVIACGLGPSPPRAARRRCAPAHRRRALMILVTVQPDGTCFGSPKVLVRRTERRSPRMKRP